VADLVELVFSVRQTMKDLAVSMRARVLETLTLLASEEKQRKYQRRAPHVNVPAELFNQWEDFYFPGDMDFRSGFVSSELAALAHFDRVLNQVSDDTPRDLPALEEFLTTEAWRALSDAARDALSAFPVAPDG
jgi:DNA-binding transcriptional MocR family regulator